MARAGSRAGAAAALRALAAADAHLVLLDEDKRPVEAGWLQRLVSGEDAAHHLGKRSGGLLGLVPASVGALVVDVDYGSPAAVEDRLGQTAAARLPTRRPGGFHLFYRVEAGLRIGNRRFRLPDSGAAGDIRHAKGCVALHALAEVPRALAALAADPRALSRDRLERLFRNDGAGDDDGGGDGPEAVVAAREGERNDRLNGEVYREARCGGLTPGRRAAYREAGIASGLQPDEVEKTLASAEKAGAGRPGRPGRRPASTAVAVVPSAPEPEPRPSRPAPAPVASPEAGAALLDRLADRFSRVAPLPSGGDAALALWAVATWTVDRFRAAPLLLLASRRPAGKTALLEALAGVVRAPQPVARIVSPDGLYEPVSGPVSRVLPPTGLLDDVGRPCAPLRRGLIEALRDGLTRRCSLRSSGSHTAFAARAVGLARSKAPEEFVPLAVTLRLPGRRPAEAPPLFPVKPPAEALRGAAEEAAAALAPALDDPDLSPDLSRPAAAAADWLPLSWGPLLALAAAAGEAWRQRAEQAAAALGPRSGVRLVALLLADLRAVAVERVPARDFLPTEDALAGLAALPDRPWAAWHGSIPITRQAIRSLLHPYGIAAVREPNSSAVRRRRRGYRLDDLRPPASWAPLLAAGGGGAGDVHQAQAGARGR